MYIIQLRASKILIVMKFSFFLGYELLLNGNNTFKVEMKESLVIMAQSRTTF
jgi:hypothetical protein